jgi:hypothetical protein
MFALTFVFSFCLLELIVEHDCEPTQFLSTCDHVIKHSTNYFKNSIILATPSTSNDLTFSKIKSQDLF